MTVERGREGAGFPSRQHGDRSCHSPGRTKCIMYLPHVTLLMKTACAVAGAGVMILILPSQHHVDRPHAGTR